MNVSNKIFQVSSLKISDSVGVEQSLFLSFLNIHFKDIQNDMKKQVSRCDRKSGRGKTTDFEREDFYDVTDNWVLPTGQGVKKAYQALFWQHARWAREEFYWNCPIIGMRVVSFF